jgi:hypothetical protein
VRVAIGTKLRVGPGDHVVVRGRLPVGGKLGRLFVFASENGAPFSPYALNVSSMIVANGKPALLPPLTMRLVPTSPKRNLSFVADIDGYVQIMQEVDSPDDPKVQVKLSRKINPNLSWIARLQRRMPSWPMTRFS